MSIRLGTTLLAGVATNTIANAHDLFDFIWSDHIKNEVSWLRADTFSWQDGTVYSDAYNHLVDDLSTATQKTDGLVEWTQPILTGATTSTDLGNVVVTCSGNYSGYDGWKAMNGVKSGTDSATGWGTNNSNSGWWQVKFPYKLLITGLKGYQRYDVTPANANTVGRFYTSSTKATPIGDEYNNATSTNWSEVEVTGIPSEGIVTDTIYFEKTSATYGGFGELEITARRVTSDHPITYYEAEDGHKIVLPDQASIVQDIYNETGVAWYYILDTTNQRFKLPRTKYGFTGLRDSVGKYISESLPNIKGKFCPTAGDNSKLIYFGGSSKAVQEGAFYITDIVNAPVEQITSGSFSGGSLALNASRSSSTYKDSAPVQQRATQMYLYFYVGEFSQSATEQTAGVTTTQLEQKVDLDAGNLSTQGKSLISSLGICSNRYDDLTLLASGETYTAPANGYFYFDKTSSGSNQYVDAFVYDKNDTFLYHLTQVAPTNVFKGRMLIEILKEYKVKFSYNLAGTTNYFRFFYSVGSESEAS